jgi:hypothetical protein
MHETIDDKKNQQTVFFQPLIFVVYMHTSFRALAALSAWYSQGTPGEERYGKRRTKSNWTIGRQRALPNITERLLRMVASML